MSWDAVAEQFLLDGDYQKLGEFYEQAIEAEPEKISHYWYLSLVYLLQEKEEEAQSIWLSVFTQTEETNLEEATAELIGILDAEANRQATTQHHHLAWQIRRQIKELAPELINNLWQLIDLEINLGFYQPKCLEEWLVIDLLKNGHISTLEYNLIDEVLPKAIKFVAEESLELVKARLSGNYTDKNIKDIARIANQLAYDHNQYLYAIELNKLCYQAQGDTLWLIKELFWLDERVKNFSEAIKIGEEFYQKSQTIPERLMGNYQLIHLYMTQGDWGKVLELSERHKTLIKQMISTPLDVIEYYIGDTFIIVSYVLLYLEDNPQENRPLQNYIAKVFQENLFKTNSITPIFAQPKLENKKLKIGYIGHTLRSHSVGWLSRWLFHYHNRENFEIAIYLLSQPEDRITKEWFKPKADLFYNFQRDSDGLIKQIQQDGINILVDLDSMTLNFTCQVLAAKPAPIQATWLGLDASGLPAIDYFIADPYVLPENAQSYYQEKIWRLPTTYLGIDGFEVGTPTLRREDLDIPSDAVIFLNIQGGLKRHPHNIRQQMRIIKQVKNSFLLIKGHADAAITKKIYTQIALEEGVSPSRLRFLPFDKTEETHRANLAIADVVLDTYPYNGATTTLEVLWMGIPLVTRVGEQFAARNSYTFMVNAGLSEGIAYTDEQYVEWGVRLGTDSLLREQVIAKLRESRKISPLWNAKQFTQDMENAYQQMWAIYQHKH